MIDVIKFEKSMKMGWLQQITLQYDNALLKLLKVPVKNTMN